MFTLTPAAARQIQQSASASGMQDLVLRIAARVDADGAIEYGMGFDDPKDDDMKLDLEGVAVVIADEFQDLLNDTVLDFVELEPGEFNFIFADARQMQGFLGSDTHFAAAPGAAPCGRATGSANLGSAPQNPGCGGGSCGSGGCGSTGRTH